MNSIDLEFILVLLIFISFVLILVTKKNNNNKSIKSLSWLNYQARSFLPILIIVLILRSFIAEPFRIPSGSMIPTLLIGDYILVNKYKYGIRMPITKSKIIKIKHPHDRYYSEIKYFLNLKKSDKIEENVSLQSGIRFLQQVKKIPRL